MHADRRADEVTEDGAGGCEEAGRSRLQGRHRRGHHLSPEARTPATQQVRAWSDTVAKI